MKDAKGHGSNPRGAAGGSESGQFVAHPTVQEASRPGIRTPVGRPERMPSDNLDTMKTIADLRARMSGTGPGHRDALGQAVRNLEGVSIERNSGRLR